LIHLGNRVRHKNFYQTGKYSITTKVGERKRRKSGNLSFWLEQNSNFFQVLSKKFKNESLKLLFKADEEQRGLLKPGSAQTIRL